MNSLEYIKALDHHAYFIHTFKDSVIHLKEYLSTKFGIQSHQNPDFFYEKFESLGIDDSRRIKENHIAKSFKTDTKRIFIIETSNITHEAQNSLLKVFEEPNEDSHFFLIMPSVHVLLPTLKSRLMIVSAGDKEQLGVEVMKNAKDFLEMNTKDKVAYVDEMAKDISDEKLSKSDAVEFLAALEFVVYKQKGNTNILKAILQAREYINDRSASIKQLLESVALSFS